MCQLDNIILWNNFESGYFNHNHRESRPKRTPVLIPTKYWKNWRKINAKLFNNWLIILTEKLNFSCGFILTKHQILLARVHFTDTFNKQERFFVSISLHFTYILLSSSSSKDISMFSQNKKNSFKRKQFN